MTTERISFIDKSFNFEFFTDFGASFTAYEAHVAGSATITVICCIAENSDFIRDNWMEIMDSLNHDYLTTEISTFQRWNTYLLFACKESVEKSLQYEIENNKFSMRKLVAELPSGVNRLSVSQTISALLSKKLLLNDIVLSEQVKKSNSWKSLLSDSGKDIVNSSMSDSQNDKDKKSRSIWIENNLSKDAKF